MSTNERWMQIEGQLKQLADAVRERREKVQHLQKALDGTRLELGHLQGTVVWLQVQPAGGCAGATTEEAAAVAAERARAQLDVIETIAEQFRELVALHRIFRELVGMLREISGNHEARIHALERRLFGGDRPAVH